MLYLSWGSFVHGFSTRGRTAFGVRRVPAQDRGGNVIGYDEIWDINGSIYEPTGDWRTLKNSLANLEIAYARGGKDALLTFNGQQLTHHALFNSQCVGGTKIIQPLQFLTSSGPQNISLRDFSVSVGGRITLVPNNYVVDFSESITYDGGGPEYDLMRTRNTKAVKILKTQYLEYTAVQEGRAVGFRSYPSPPRPLWPQHLMKPQAFQGSFEYGEPFGVDLINKPVTWRYEYKSTEPFVGLPSYW